ncbi:uncharacterized protein BX664DRAFT_356294 [Halteromyces radiatus]|uniref:uncharacterized protein n=1 Tax=Halteromyces radiatus TaxID=101107 RepID=UPI002220610A|nr:uncharacterized protein BX664DRAFT_356294 [Halteromyces radiatus]KAI8097004.1 hypothetical protein BX664DRAFT_356294 [Halteromyces radiatus]
MDSPTNATDSAISTLLVIDEEEESVLSSLAIGMIVLCALSVLILTIVCILILRKRYSPSTSTSLADKDDSPRPVEKDREKGPFTLPLAMTKRRPFWTILSRQRTRQGITTLDEIPLPTTATSLEVMFEEGYDTKAFFSPRHHWTTSSLTSATSSFVDDPCIIDSLERQKHINDMYYTSHPPYHHTFSLASSNRTTLYNNHPFNSSLISLSSTEKQEQEAELQRLSISSYHVW